MRQLPIRFKITLWFTAALLVMFLSSYLLVRYLEHQGLQKNIRDNLVETVEHNVDEVEFYTNMDNIDLYNETDYFSVYRNGYLEIDDDFLDQVNEVYTGLYSTDMVLLYGENPVSRNTATLPFSDSKIQRVKEKGILYYIYDRKLTAKGLEGLWLRGVVSEQQGLEHILQVTRLSLQILPLLVLVSAIGGYFLTKKMLKPIQEISNSAAKIGTGDDLKQRISLAPGNDELHQLARSFNQMFERLENAFEKERQFTSDASHELRTPVSVITAQCEFTLEKPRTGEEYENALETILRQSKKMSRLINDMLDYIRLEMRAESYKKETIDLTELVESLCFDMALIKEKDIVLSWEVEKNICFSGSRLLLSRLLTNLISNAYRYGKEEGHIFVCLKRREHQITLSVSDDGIGIAQEEQLKIFQRFYQADTSHSGSGTGLGLSMADQIVRFHKGSIRVESALGKGSTFYIFFME
ncbi:ATP-binding protein [Lachnospiraceae bacterium 38-14]|uniref:sensor histidine kinase n=1 Tax=Roseburia sp. 1XD42-69 TaxID=2320088 RepID=UPI000EA1E909|nr:ATP-binding protein [Roseburia sp. 1XD42-69]RKJ66159.1 HAMP domain-containing protein [Roseburia sp. 1XD42-69]